MILAPVFQANSLYVLIVVPCYNPPSMESNQKNQRQLWVGIVISLICLAVIFWLIDPAEIWQALKTAQYRYLLLSALGILGFLAIRAIRWRFMFHNQVSWMQVFHIQNIGYMLNMTLPFRLGDVARAILIGNVPPVTLASGISTMVVERILDLLFIVALFPFTIAQVPTLPPWMREAAQGFGIAALVGIVILIIAANQRPFAGRVATFFLNYIPFMDTKRWVRRIDELLAGLGSLTNLSSGVQLIFWSIVTWLPILFAYHTTMWAVNLNPTWSMTAFVVCAAAFSVTLPSSPGQIGVFHAGVTASLVALGQPEGQSASFAIVYHALNILMMVIVGVVGLAGTGATFGSVVTTTRQFMQRKEKPE